jgi:hypothetical protein
MVFHKGDRNTTTANTVSLRKQSMFIAFVILPIAVGTAVYVGWRTNILFVFDWMAVCGIPADAFRPAVSLPPTILYSLPDGCWVFAGTSWMLLIWDRLHVWVFTFLVLGVGGEFGQAIRFVPGTFEWNDIAFCISGFTLPVIGYKYAQTFFLNGRVVDHGRTCCG